MPVTIRHERTPSMSDASAYNRQYQKRPVVQNTTPQVEQRPLSGPADKNASSVDVKPWKEPDAVVTSVDLQAGKAPVDEDSTRTAGQQTGTESVPAESGPAALPQVYKESGDEESPAKAEQQTSQETADEERAPALSPEADSGPVAEESSSASDQQTHRVAADEEGASAAGQQSEKGPVAEANAPTIAQQNRKEPIDPSVTALVALLKEKNLISADEAARIIEKSESNATIAKERIRDQVRSEVHDQVSEVRNQVKDDVRGQVKSEVRDQVKSEVGEALPKEISKVEQSLPDWIRRIHFGGDIRLRYENDRFDKNNALTTNINQGTDTQTLQNSWANADHFKYRVRLGAGMAVNDQLDFALRLSTGNTSNPVSTNTILGNYMNKDNVLFDLAYLRWQLADFITIYGGRMPNPWFTPSWLVWDDDLNFEGFALKARKPVSDSWTSFLNAGVFPLQHVDPASILDSQHSKWLFGGQVGLEKKNRKGISANVGVSYYHFSNITGKLNTHSDSPGLTDWSAPLFQQRGNTLFYIDSTNSLKVGLASQFRELNVGGTIDIGFWDPFHVVLIADYVKNLGFNQSRVNAVVGDIKPDDPDDPSSIGFQETPRNTTGYQIGASVGYPTIEKFGQWKAQLQYKYIGADAVVDAFTDSDFHLGGTNAKGWILGADFGLLKNSWIAMKWITANEISGPPLAIDVLFVDFNARF